MTKQGSEIKLKLSKYNGTLGTIDSKNTTAFYIVLGLWVNCELTTEEQVEYAHQLTKSISHQARALSIDLSPDYVYSFISIELSENFTKGNSKHAYLSIETTVMVNSPIQKFSSNTELKNNAIGYLELLSDKVEEHNAFTYGKRRVKILATS